MKTHKASYSAAVKETPIRSDLYKPTHAVLITGILSSGVAELNNISLCGCEVGKRKSFWKISRNDIDCPECIKKLKKETNLNQIGCGYCYKEKRCSKWDPKQNKAKAGCLEFIHWSKV